MQQHYHCRYRETDETPLAVVVVVVVAVINSVVIIVVVAFRFYQLPIELRAGRQRPCNSHEILLEESPLEYITAYAIIKSM